MDPEDFVEIAAGPARAWIRRGYEQWAAMLGLHGPPESAVRVSGGRAAHPVVTLPNGERALVRAYLRGGFVRHFNRARYFGGSRAHEELLATEQARRAGVRTPFPLAAVQHRLRVGYTASLATSWIPEARDLAALLAEAPPAAKHPLLADAGEQIARMHAGGIAHPDLNLRNLLVSRGEVYVIDFDRARRFSGPVPPKRRARDLQRLARSARKLEVEPDSAGWDAFRRGYGAGWPLREPLG